MTAVRVGFYFPILFIPTYFEVDIGLLPSGGCSYVNLVGGVLWLGPILKLNLGGVVGCQVNT